ncbi:MAG: adenylosuccinate synthetase [Comamonadaceae bacterium]|nr:adenylosuccinate synthetase [Comamonadaceae bacterium]
MLPLDADEIVACQPIYETLPGWTDTHRRPDRTGSSCRSTRAATSSACRPLIGAPIDMVSTGPDRVHTILLRHPFRA